MRKEEKNFASPAVKLAAGQVGKSIRLARLARNMTQEAAAKRAKMSTYTWIKIEKGEVSVSMSSWLSALECIDLLHALNLQASDVQQHPLLNAAVRQRAHSRTANIDFDF